MFDGIRRRFFRKSEKTETQPETPVKPSTVLKSSSSSSSSAPVSASTKPSSSSTSSSSSSDTSSSSSLSAALSSWILPFPLVFTLIGLVRVIGVHYLNLITDCDESMNYWEPTHYLLYGRGLQTWEYSPQYGLRSYAYTGLHAVIGILVGAGWGVDKITVFHRTRMVLALVSAFCESIFYYGVSKRFGPSIGNYTLLGLISSAGLVHAAPAYLPSSFTMYGSTAAWGLWLAGSSSLGIIVGAFGLLLGWPFALAAIVPMGLHMLLNENLVRITLAGGITTVTVLGMGAVVDHYYYGKWLIAPWNIIRYNALGEGGGGQGSNLYGVEPASYFVHNLILNFNIIAVLAALSPVFVALLPFAKVVQSCCGKRSTAAVSSSNTSLPSFWWTLTSLAQVWLWFFVMSIRPHKEERFMFVIYPLLALTAAVTVHLMDVILTNTILKCFVHYKPFRMYLRRSFIAGIYLLAAALSIARIMALVNAYSAPFAVWTTVGRHLQGSIPGLPETSSRNPALYAVPKIIQHYFPAMETGEPALPGSRPGARVCVGKEWYRYPASFFLPERTKESVALFAEKRPHTPGGPAEIAFIPNNFSGLLPQPYLPGIPDGSRQLRTGFNDENRFEPGSYVDLETCDYIIDLQLPPQRTRDAHYEPYFRPDKLLVGDSPHKCTCTNDAVTEGEETTSVKHTNEPYANLRWHSIYQHKFLDAETTKWYARTFWIPGYSDHYAKWATYHILQKLDCCRLNKMGSGSHSLR